MQIKKDLARVFTSNVINVVIGVVSGLIIPAFLSLDQYAYFKTFSLYLSYIGILHFGFADGLYIKYGGANEEEIKKPMLKGERKFLLVFQIIISLIVGIAAIFLNDKILLAFSIAIVPYNMLTFYKFFYQAIGQFTVYSKIMLLPPNILFVINVVLIYILKLDNHAYFVVGNLISYYIAFIVLDIVFYSKYKIFKSYVDRDNIKKHFKIGFTMMLGNLAMQTFYAIDRWFVKIALDLDSFAYYSFGLSMMSMVIILINSVTTIFYTYFSRNNNDIIYKKYKNYFLIIGSLASAGYFGFSIIVTYFIPKYIPSLSVISILFAGFPAIITISALYVNLYKVQKNDKLYVVTVLIMLIFSIVLNFAALFIWKSMISIACATTISFYIWYYYSSHHFKVLFISSKEICYLALYLVCFLISSNVMGVWSGLFLYIICLYGLILIFFKTEISNLFLEIVKRKSKASN